jgi:hypothetical protein
MVDRAEPLIEVTRVAADRGSRWRTRFLIGGWLLALVGVPATAMVGGPAEGGSPAEPAAQDPPAVAATPLAVTGPYSSRRDMRNPSAPSGPTATIVLNRPIRGTRLTTVDVAVGGYLQDDADSVHVVLETAGEVVLSQATVLPALAFGERPEANRHLQFQVRLVLPSRRPTGDVAVRVAAYDRAGRQIAMVRRPFTLDPIVRPTLGDDGLLGGLAFSDG